MKDPTVFVEAVIGAQTRRPSVALISPAKTVFLSPAAAYQVAQHLIGAAGASIADAAVLEMYGGEALTTEEAAEILDRFRKIREGIDAREGTAES
jgi:hypothetical protein